MHRYYDLGKKRDQEASKIRKKTSDKGQIKSDKENQAGIKDRQKKLINPLKICVNGLVNI